MSKIKQYVNMLATTDEQTLDKIEEYEKKGLYNEHLDTNPAPYITVDKNYKYLPKNPFVKAKRALQDFFFLKPFCKEANKLFQTQIVGRENLKDVQGAVVCCNHVNKLDCMAIRYALAPKKVYFTTAEFNNMKGFIGDMMRAGGILPMSENFAAQKNFVNAVSTVLKRKQFVTFFPERSEWWGYEKPRPHENGAYHVAARNNVPILPVFITFNQTEESKKSRTGIKQFVVNILPPIYPNAELSLKQNMATMKEKCESVWQQTYNEFYKK